MRSEFWNLFTTLANLERGYTRISVLDFANFQQRNRLVLVRAVSFVIVISFGFGCEDRKETANQVEAARVATDALGDTILLAIQVNCGLSLKGKDHYTKKIQAALFSDDMLKKRIIDYNYLNSEEEVFDRILVLKCTRDDSAYLQNAAIIAAGSEVFVSPIGGPLKGNTWEKKSKSSKTPPWSRVD